MRKGIRFLVLVALSLTLAAPALAQSTPKPKAEPAKTEAPAFDRAKAYLLQQEFVAATAELRGKVWAKQAELEILLCTKPDDEATVKKLVGEITALRGSLFEQMIQFRLRMAKEAGVPMPLAGHMLAPRRGGDKGMMRPRGRGMPPHDMGMPSQDMGLPDAVPDADGGAKAGTPKKP